MAVLVRHSNVPLLFQCAALLRADILYRISPKSDRMCGK